MARTRNAILIGQARDWPEPHPAQGEEFTVVPTSWIEGRRRAPEIEEEQEQEHQQDWDRDRVPSVSSMANSLN